MSVVLEVNNTAMHSGEAYLTWTIDPTVVAPSSSLKVVLYLTYLDGTRNIQKYQLHDNEYETGSHIFSELTSGQYGAELVVFRGSVISESSSVVLSAYTLEAPVLTSANVLPKNEGVDIELPAYSGSLLSDQAIVNVTFVLFDKSKTDFRVCDHVNFTFDYIATSPRLYSLTSGLSNNKMYEVACFYTDNNNITSELSSTIAFQPTLKPSKIQTPGFAIYQQGNYGLLTFNLPANYKSLNATSIVLKTYKYDTTSDSWQFYNYDFSIPITNTASDNAPIVFAPLISYWSDYYTVANANRVYQSQWLADNSEYKVTMLLRNEFGDSPISDYIYFFNTPERRSDTSDDFNKSRYGLLANQNYGSLSCVMNNGGDNIKINRKAGYVLDSRFTNTYKLVVQKITRQGTGPYWWERTNVLTVENYALGSTLGYAFELGQDYTANLITTSTYTLHDANNTVITLQPPLPYIDSKGNSYYANNIDFVPHYPLTYKITLKEPVAMDHSIKLEWDSIPEDILNKGYKYATVTIKSYDADYPTNTSSMYYSQASSVSVLSPDAPNFVIFSQVWSDGYYSNYGTMNLINGKNLSFEAVLYVQTHGFPNGHWGDYPTTAIVPYSTTSNNKVVGRAMAPPTLVKNSQTPGDSNCVINVAADLQGGDFDTFILNVNGSVYSDFTRSGSGPYTFTVNGLQNDVVSTISIVLQNKYLSTTMQSSPLIVTTTPFAMPAAPQSLSAMPYTNRVELSWAAETKTVTAGRRLFREVYYKKSSDSTFVLANDNNTSSTETITDLSSNILHDFKVSNCYYDNETTITYRSDFSTTFSRTFVYLNPPVMSIDAGTAIGSVDVTLSVPKDSSDAYLNYYNAGSFVYHAKATKGASVISTSVSSSNQSEKLTLNGLTDLSEYIIESYYEMLNLDTGDYYSSDTVSNEVVPFDPLLAPVLTLTPFDGEVEVKLDITPLNGLDIQGYERKIAGSWVPYTFDSVGINSTGVESQNIQVKVEAGLTNGIAFNIELRAVILNADLTDHSASVSGTKTPFKEASAPQSVASVPSSQQIDISWVAPADLGGLPVDHYEVKLDEGAWVPAHGSFAHSFTDLDNGTEYFFKVRAVTSNIGNGLGYWNGVESSSYSNIPYDLPILTIDDCVSSNASLSVDLSSDELFGLSLVRYELSIDGGANWLPYDQSDVGLVVNGLVNGTEYYIKVRSVLSHEYLGELISSPSAQILATPYEAASVPRSVALAPSNEQLVVSWVVPENLGGLGVDHYEVKLDSDDWVSTGVSLTHTFTDLNNGQTYSVVVRAVTKNMNFANDSVLLPSSGLVNGAVASSTAIPFTNSLAPVIVNTVMLVDQGVNVIWAVPTDNGGFAVNHYEVKSIRHSDSDESSWVNAGNNLNYQFTSLSNGIAYRFKVRAITLNTNVNPSVNVIGAEYELLAPVTPFAKPNQVSNLSASVVNDLLTVTFTQAVDVNNGLTQYTVYSLDSTNYANSNSPIVSGSNGSISTATTSFTLFVYTYIENPNVLTERVYGSARSVTISKTTSESGIENLQASSSSNSIILSWTNLGASGTLFVVDKYETDGSITSLTPGGITATTYSATGLTYGVNYKFAVHVKDQIESELIYYTLVGAPSIVSAVLSGNTLNITANFGGDSYSNIGLIKNNSISGDVSVNEVVKITSTSLPVDVTGYDFFIIIISNSVGLKTVTTDGVAPISSGSGSGSGSSGTDGYRAGDGNSGGSTTL